MYPPRSTLSHNVSSIYDVLRWQNVQKGKGEDRSVYAVLFDVGQTIHLTTDESQPIAFSPMPNTFRTCPGTRISKIQNLVSLLFSLHTYSGK